MSLARVKTRCRQGLSAPLVSVEIHLSAGLPTIALVGFSEATVRDAKERVRSAILSTGFRWPDSLLTISISPPHSKRPVQALTFQSQSRF